MKTKIVKKKRLNIARTLVFILFIYIIVCLGLYIYQEPVRHYQITGNKIIKDIDIIRDLDLEDYPSYVSINTKKLSKRLESNPLIKKAKVSYGWNFEIKINIEENKPVFIVKTTNQVCLSDGTLVDYSDDYVNIPVLLNNPTEDIMKMLAKSLSKVEDGIMYLISEIEYSPSYNSQNKVIDNNRFLLSMKDKNLVFITARRADTLNNYLNIIAAKQIVVNGTFYLDGNEGSYTFKKADQTTSTTTKKEGSN